MRGKKLNERKKEREISNLMPPLTNESKFQISKQSKKSQRNGNLFAATIRLSAAYNFIEKSQAKRKTEHENYHRVVISNRS